LPEERVNKAFDLAWPNLEESLKKIVPVSSATSAPSPAQEEMRLTHKLNVQFTGGWSYPYRTSPWVPPEEQTYLNAKIKIEGFSLPVEDLIRELKKSISSYFSGVGYKVTNESRTFLRLERGREIAMFFSSDVRNVPTWIDITFDYDYQKEILSVNFNGQACTKGCAISNLDDLHAEFERYKAEFQLDLARLVDVKRLRYKRMA
jgi:hypothetical protein